MNEKQKRISLIFLILVCLILLAICSVIAFSVYKNQLAQVEKTMALKEGTQKDDSKTGLFELLKRSTEKEEEARALAWIEPTLILLAGFSAIIIVLFIGLWQIYKSPEKGKE